MDQRLGAGAMLLPAAALPDPSARAAAGPAAPQEPSSGDPSLLCPSAADVPPELSPPEKAQALRQLAQQEVANCRRCLLAGNRTHVVFGEGNPDADLVFIGEGPGQDEDRTGRPFVGRAGELLNRMIHAMGLRRDQVYIANMVKCRPPDNRPPAPEEVQACWSFLLRQLEIIRPKVIVTLGNPSTQGLLRTSEGITKVRGLWRKLPAISPAMEGIDVMPTFHPAYLLRNYSRDCREKVWSDLQQVMRKLGLKPPAGGRAGSQGP